MISAEYASEVRESLERPKYERSSSIDEVMTERTMDGVKPEAAAKRSNIGGRISLILFLFNLNIDRIAPTNNIRYDVCIPDTATIWVMPESERAVSSSSEKSARAPI